MIEFTNEMTGEVWVQIEVAENEFTSMLKSIYEEQQAQAVTPAL